MITGKKLWNKEARAGILFASPVIAGFLIFVLGPMIASFIFSLSEYNVITPLKIIGFSNYADLFDGTDPLFYKSLGVTAYYVILSVPLQILLAFMVALLLNHPIKGKAFFRTVFYMPTIVPAVASSMIWLWLFDPDLGLLNQLLKVFGIPGLQWIYSENLAVPSLVLMSLWTIGGTMVIFLAGLQGIPKHLYESVEVDGGGPLHKLFSITIPLMTPTIFFNLIMGFIGSFQVFGQAYIMTQGGPNNATLFYSYYLYREAFEFSSMGSASAIAWVMFLIILALTMMVFKTSALWVYSESEGKR